jgi:ssDNA-binding Zn-finger/Zn-ribbon topoisomerase 1
MAFKAEDYEKKMGECPKHGAQVLWLTCKHVGKGEPDEIWLGPNRIAICPACSMLPVSSIEEELLVACEACIKAKIKSLSGRLAEGEDIRDHVKGLDVYEKELMTGD